MGKTNKLYVGAGKAVIRFSKEIFPTWEGYTGIHDDPQVEVVIVDCGTQFCLANFELISLNDEVGNFQKLLREITGIPEENCWITVSHVLPTAHLWLAQHKKTREDIDKNEIMVGNIRAALTEAAEAAVRSKTEAVFGTGSGPCYANVNRNVLTDRGWWLGYNEEGPVIRDVAVLRFDRTDGTPIAVLFNYHSQCSILDDVYTRSGDRLISSDFAGAAARYVEKELGHDVVCAYLLGAGGDTAPALKGIHCPVGKDGKQTDVVMHEEAYVLVDVLGERLGQEVVRISERICCEAVAEPMQLIHDAMTLKGKFIPDTKKITPQKEYEYVPAADVTMPIEILMLGDLALIGIKPEICSRTMMRIMEASPFRTTALMTFVNGGAKYMPESDMYDMITYQSMNSRFAKGAAELFSERIINLLHGKTCGEEDA